MQMATKAADFELDDKTRAAALVGLENVCKGCSGKQWDPQLHQVMSAIDSCCSCFMFSLKLARM